MDFTIYFCNDGTLRAKFSDNKPLIPVKFLQENGANQNNDLKFWSRWWESNVYFEEGLTVGKFLFCLEPWAQFWTDITGKNVAEYIKEARRPFLLKKDNPDDPPLDWVGLFYHTEASPSTEYDKTDDDLFEKDINAWFQSKKDMRLTGEWEIYSSYKLSGFRKGVEEQYSIDYTPMNELANLPMILSNKQWLYFSNWSMERVLGKTKGDIFKKDAFGVCSLPKAKMKFLLGEKHHRMRDVVEGFFWWMYSTPARRQDFVDQLMDAKYDIDAMRDNHDVVVVDEKSNVVNLFDKNEEAEKEDSSDERKLQVKVVPGAFDSLISAYEQDSEYWEDMLKLANKQEKVVLKIGKTQEAKAPETRLFGYIVPEDDLKANPQPTEFKKV